MTIVDECRSTAILDKAKVAARDMSPIFRDVARDIYRDMADVIYKDMYAQMLPYIIILLGMVLCMILLTALTFAFTVLQHFRTRSRS